jgi:hypothetical protein
MSMGPFHDGWTTDDVEAVIARGETHELLYVPIVASLNAADCPPGWAEAVCVRLAGHPDPQVRGNALMGFGHIARTCGMLDMAVVGPLLAAGRVDPNPHVKGQADEACGDIRVFLGVEVDTRRS